MQIKRCLHFIRYNVTIIEDNRTQVVFKSRAPPFMSSITKIHGTIIEDAEDFADALSMQICNLLESILNYSDTTSSLFLYSKNELANFSRVILKYKVKLMGNALAQSSSNVDNKILENARSAVPLKYPSKLLRSLKILLIYCKAKFKLKWTKHYIWPVLDIKKADTNSAIGFTIKD